MASRQGAIERAQASFDSGRFVERLSELVAVPTESADPSRYPDLVRYCTDVLRPMVEELGCNVQVLDNPLAKHGPFLLGTRIEDPALPTVMVYGHGDVVVAQPSRWRADLDPFKVKVEGDKIFGRGVVDNKGQHLLGLESLRAVIAERGSLGFNLKVMIETEEEVASPGLWTWLEQHKDICAADVFIALDGPRHTTFMADVNLGTRGVFSLDLVVDLREGSHHSGHWGGLLVDAGVVLAHAIASIVSRDGRILVPKWTPEHVAPEVLDACRAVVFEDMPGLPEADPAWGEPGLSKAERIYAWTSVIVLASVSGQPELPTNAVQGQARARIQLRHTVDVNQDDFVPSLRAHLDANGLQVVQIVTPEDQVLFPASRTDINDPWVQAVVRSMTETAGRRPNIVPNGSASGPSELFKQALDVPVMWIPHSYGGCGQHGPNEHGLGSLFRDGLGVMAGIWWDLADKAAQESNPR
jgi:acetylornithine deacetylase/succinyl-diaminopimelate desuccinylase-like protein